MTQESSAVTSPMQRRLAARRLEFDDEEQDSRRPPDSAGVEPTVLEAPPVGQIAAAAQQPSEGQDLGMRRDVDAMMAQITALMISSVVHNALAQGVQHQNAAAAQPRTSQHDAAGDVQAKMLENEQPEVKKVMARK